MPVRIPNGVGHIGMDVGTTVNLESYYTLVPDKCSPMKEVNSQDSKALTLALCLRKKHKAATLPLATAIPTVMRPPFVTLMSAQ